MSIKFVYIILLIVFPVLVFGQDYRLNGVILLNDSIVEEGCDLEFDLPYTDTLRVKARYIPGDIVFNEVDFNNLIQIADDSIQLTLISPLFSRNDLICDTVPTSYTFTVHKDLLKCRYFILDIKSLCYSENSSYAKYINPKLSGHSFWLFLLTGPLDDGTIRHPVHPGIRQNVY